MGLRQGLRRLRQFVTSRQPPIFLFDRAAHSSSSRVGGINNGPRSRLSKDQMMSENNKPDSSYYRAESFSKRKDNKDHSQPKSDAILPDGVLAVPLLRHQRIALSWMVKRETSLKCSGGILADDQGLGKTVSIIALILKERPPATETSRDNDKDLDKEKDILSEKQDPDAHLSISNETSEKRMKSVSQNKGRLAGGTLVVCPTSILRQWAEELCNKVTKKGKLSVLIYHGSNRMRDPCELAKYDVVLTTYSIVSMEVPEKPLADGEDEDKGKPLAMVKWFRVVLDEAQSIKNHRTQVAKACCGLQAKCRWCLSGTPIQNVIDDLYSYFRFLRYDPYAVYESFCKTIKFPIRKDPTMGYRNLQVVLKTIMLRRTKDTHLYGKPIIDLPPKTIKLRRVEFSAEERDFYSRLECGSRARFEEYASAGTVNQNYVNILSMLLRLRQACNHPLLVGQYESKSSWKSAVEKAKKLSHDKQVFLSKLFRSIFGSMWHLQYAVVSECGHVFCSQCIGESLACDDSQCPNRRCKVRLTLSSVFSKATLKRSLSDQPDDSEGMGCEVFDDCSYYSSKIKAALEDLLSVCKPKIVTTENRHLQGSVDRNGSCFTTSDVDGVELLEEGSNRKNSGVDGSSNKSVKVVREKAIVFSQWTRMLDLFELSLEASGLEYRRLDGTMPVIARDKAVKDFNTLPEVSVMIMSLKAAGLGLNMVAANHVLLLDPWWNPATEDQAIGRAHRIGQTRPVTVYRFTVKDTIEDRILALQQKKRKMVASAFGEDQPGGLQTRLTEDDLKYLFNTEVTNKRHLRLRIFIKRIVNRFVGIVNMFLFGLGT